MKANKRHLKSIAILFLVLAAGAFAWGFFLRPTGAADGVIALSGRVESDDAAVAAKIAGRVREINVREGDPVKANQVIAVLDDEQVKAREEQERSAVEQAEASVRQAEQEVAVLHSQLEQSRLGVNQARVDAQGRVSEAEARLAAAEAELARAQADYRQAQYDKARFLELAEHGVVSQREGQQFITTADTKKAVMTAAERQVEAARAAVTTARASLDNPAIRTAQAAAIEKQIVQAQSAIMSAQAEANRARARLAEAQANRRDLQIIAPFDGIVATRAVEPGEVIAAGTPIVTVLNLGQVYLRGFIPEGQIGRVRVGQPARVYLDSNSRQPFEAIVSRVDPQASFTPENTYFRDDRVKQVVGVKLQLIDPQGFAKPGMPADGEVLVEGSQWVTAKR